MKKLIMLPVALAMIQLVGCATNSESTTVGAPTVPTQAVPTGPVVNGPLGGKLEYSMDSNDKTKLSQAMDKAVGKATTWENASTGIHYSATPTQKVTINGNPYCRRYQVIAVKNGNERAITGTACVSPSDGSWQVVGY